MPVQRGVAWLAIVPIAQSRSSYDGLLLFVFMIISAWLAAIAIHRLASDKLRRAPAWDCGYPDASTIGQYTASSFAQPIRRVFGTVLFRAREELDMPPPGSPSPARLTVVLRDPVWEGLYLPLAAAVTLASERLNRLLEDIHRARHRWETSRRFRPALGGSAEKGPMLLAHRDVRVLPPKHCPRH